MKVIDILNNTDKPVFSFELIPPLKGGDINKIYEAIEPLIALAPPFINITFHRDEVVYREYPDGTIKKVTITKRPGSVALAAAIMRRYNVDMVPHIVCGGATRHKIENELIDLNFLDIENVMAQFLLYNQAQFYLLWNIKSYLLCFPCLCFLDILIYSIICHHSCQSLS